MPMKDNSVPVVKGSKDGSLTISKQDVFCKHFFNSDSDTFLDCTNSGIKAGYTHDTAERILYEISTNGKYQDISRNLREYKDKFNKSVITIDKIIEKLNLLVNLIQSNPDERKASGYTSADTLKALELCGKYLKMWSETEDKATFVLNIHAPGERRDA